MKLKTVIGSVNNNPEYYLFIPKQIFFWSIFNIKFIAIFVGDKIPDELIEYKDNIILWNRNKNINSAYTAQNIRMYYTSLIKLEKDEMVMMTDMDMLPMSIKYYIEGLEEYNKDDFIYIRNVDYDRKEIYMCYNLAHPSLWSELFKINSEDDIEKKLNENYVSNYNGNPGENAWFTDQRIMYDTLINYKNLIILNRPITRLETWMYKEHLNKNDKNFIHSYDDCHFHRSYLSNKNLIEDAEMQMRIVYNKHI